MTFKIKIVVNFFGVVVIGREHNIGASDMLAGHLVSWSGYWLHGWVHWKSSCTFTTYVQGIDIQCPRGKNGTILSCQLFWSEIKISLDHLDICILPSENLVY